jgi:hypothetical protein
MITFKELQDATDPSTVTNTITFDDKETIDKYYNSIDQIYPYYMNWAHNVIATHWQVRFAEVELNGDTVLFAYKRVSFFAVKYLRILFYPISINGNTDNELAVYDQLIRHEDVTEILTREPQGKVVDQDFYIDATEKFNEINTSKYRSKHRINILKNDPQFNVRLATPDDKGRVMSLLDHWQEHKGKDYSGAVFKGFRKRYDQLVIHPNIKIWVMTYYGIILGVYVYINTTHNNYYQIINVALNRKNAPDIQGDVVNKILSDSSQIHIYFTLEQWHNDIGTLTFAGGRIPSLLAYKKRVYKNSVKYYRKKIR